MGERNRTQGTYTLDPAPAKTKIALVDRPSSVQSVINISRAINLKPGPPDAIRPIANDILGGQGGRLYNNLREKQGAYVWGLFFHQPGQIRGRVLG